jgi:hypothetical protein
MNAIGFVAVLSLSFVSPEDEALKILMRRWAGSGGTGEWNKVLNTSYELKCDDKIYCAFLALECGSGESSSGPLAEGNWKGKDKRIISWKCQSLDAKKGHVIIAGQKFDLAKGGLFVIGPKGEKITIYQLAPDLGRLSKVSVQKLVAEQAEQMPALNETLKAFGIFK